MRFFEQKKTLKPDDLSVLKRFVVFSAEWTGLEPATPCVTGMYSNQLNYHSVLGLQIYAAFCITQVLFEKNFLIVFLYPLLSKNTFLLCRFLDL